MKHSSDKSSVDARHPNETPLRRRVREKAPPLDWQTALTLPHTRQAFVYQRFSTTEQVKNHLYSIQMQDGLEDLAIADGYAPDFSFEERIALRQDAAYQGWYRNGQIIVEQRDLGISGTKGASERPGLQHLIRLIEANRVESVYVVHISRLYRDQTLIDAFAFGELCKEYDVKLISPYMRLNLRIPMHMEWYRREADWAAKELDNMKNRLLGARDVKARQGRWAGGTIPAGYVLDTRRTIMVNGQEVTNPNFEKYQIYEPHAKVIRLIFEQLALPGRTTTQVLRYCQQHGIRFEPMPLEVAQTRINTSPFSRRQADPDGGWPVTPASIVSIVTNPAYIGWRVWSGEVVHQDNHPPIVPEEVFWAAQQNIRTRASRPKGEKPPLPLAGLLYCGEHDEPHQMLYSRRDNPRRSTYICRDSVEARQCCSMMAHFIDDAVCDFVLSQFSQPDLADAVLEHLEQDYSDAREQADAAKREVARLDQEIENLEHNYRVIKLTPERATRIEAEIAALMEQRRKLTDLDAYPVGKVVRSLSREDIGLVRSVLSDLRQIWSDQTDDLRNIFLRLVLSQVIVFQGETTVRAVIRWRTGAEHVIDIRRYYVRTHEAWSAEENALIHEYYLSDTSLLAKRLPERTYAAIRNQAQKLGLTHPERGGAETRLGKRIRHWTEEEDEIVRQVARNEIYLPEAVELLGRTEESIRGRFLTLGIQMQRPVMWTLVDTRTVSTEEHDPRMSRCLA